MPRPDHDALGTAAARAMRTTRVPPGDVALTPDSAVASPNHGHEVFDEGQVGHVCRLFLNTKGEYVSMREQR